MIKVSNTLTVYEVGGQETKVGSVPKLEVRSHWNRQALIVLEIGGQSYTVAADDLTAAIRNATNSGHR